MTALVRLLAISGVAAGLALTGCSDRDSAEPESTSQEEQGHEGHDHAQGEHPEDEHAHGEEISIGTTKLGEIEIECWQGHGAAEPGKELLLVVKLPYSDKGATTVRAWIGTEDRFAALVAKAEYAPSHDDYDVHAAAPKPLPDNAQWWIEIQKPDGSKHIGSISLN